MRILITGSNGMLGSDLVELLKDQFEIAGLGLNENRHSSIPFFKADLGNRSAIVQAVNTFRPAIIVHAAAYTDVDGCESHPHQAYLINTKGTQCIAEASNQTGATLIFISSDYVFDGKKDSAYLETDPANPISVYGQSKFEAEEWLKEHSNSVSIIRSSWLFGKSGRNFFRAILGRLKEGNELSVVDDQQGAPTYTLDLAGGIKSFIQHAQRPKGYEIYHLANTGFTTWYGAAKKLIAKTGVQKEIKPITSTELNRPAKRPKNSVLNLNKIKSLYGIELRGWEEALDHFWEHVLRSEWKEMVKV